MRDLLAGSSRGVLRDLARPGTLLVFDFDGTLAPIVRHPPDARLARRTRALLAAASSRFTVAILSGRSVDDVRRRIEGLDVRWVVGNHGAEWPSAPPPASWRRLVGAWGRALRRRLKGLDGVEIEEKGLSLSIHWRGARSPVVAGAAALEAALRIPGANVIPGKKVLNVLPDAAGDKGTALRRLVEESRCARVLFVGDDATDEAAFREPLPNAVMVRVGRSAASSAPYYLARRADVDRLLERLVATRTAEAG